jgi:hypothetical protein
MECKARAVLIVTRSVDGTTTNVARRRVELTCSKPAEHSGPHFDVVEKQGWEAEAGKVVTVLKHEG